MSTDRPTRDSMSLEEATISNMWEAAAMVEVLERTGRGLYYAERTRGHNQLRRGVVFGTHEHSNLLARLGTRNA